MTAWNHEAMAGDQAGRTDAGVSPSVLAYLRAVVAASEHLVAEADLKRGIDAALRLHTGLDRVYVFRDAPDTEGVYLYGESTGPGVNSIGEHFGSRVYRDEDFPAVIPPLRAGEVYRSVHPQRAGENAAFNTALATQADLMVPVFAGDRFWGIVGFDDCHASRAWTPAEVAALKGAASAIAAAVLRDAATAAQSQQASELAMRDRLLAAVARSMEALLGSDGSDFSDAVRATLGALGQACGIHRVKVIMQRMSTETSEPVHVLEHEWWAPGLVSQESLGLTRFPNSLIPEWTAVLERGGALWYLIEDVPTQVRAAFEAVGVRSVGSVPIFGADRYLGLIAFDDCVARRVWSGAEIDALTAAARTIGGAIHRHQLQQAMLEERDRHIEVKRQRAEEAEAANAQLTRRDSLLRAASEASQHLAAEADVSLGLQRALDTLRQHTGADRVFLNRYAPAERATYFWLESRHPEVVPFVAGFGPGPWPDADFAQVSEPLLQGRVYRSTRTQRDGANAAHNQILGSLSDLIVPVFVEGRYAACLGFDDHHEERVWLDADVAVLQTVAAAIASALQRDATTRAREQERQRYEALLRAVAEASAHLLGASEFNQGLDKAMEALGRHGGHSRAYAWALSPDQQACSLVAEWDAPGIPRATEHTNTTDLPVEAFAEVWAPLLAGREYRSVAPTRTSENAALNETVAARSGVMVPVFVGGRCWGCIGFDDCEEERRYSSAEIDVLKTAANAVAAAVSRQHSEQARLNAERLRADDTVQVNRLLEGVVAASRVLLEDDDFEAAMKGWLAHLAEAVDADRAIYGDFAPACSEAGVASEQVAWSREGLPDTKYDGIPATSDFQNWTDLLRRGETIWAHRDELRDPISVRFWEKVRCWTNLIVPVMVDQTTVGWLCFDFATRREWKPAFGSVLRTAADSAAAAIKRRSAVKAMLVERDRRIEAERLRADESARHAERTERHSALLAAVAASAEELLATRDPGQRLDAVLQRVGEVTHALRACVARIDWLPGDHDLHGWQEIVHEWTKSGVARQIDGPLRRFAMARADATWQHALAQFSTERRILAVISEQGEPFRSEQTSLGVVWSLCYPILVEGQVWGLLGMDYATRIEDYDEADLAALQTLASTIADALSRQRLERRTLDAERSRAAALRKANDELIASTSRLAALKDIPTFLDQLLLSMTRSCGARTGTLFAKGAVDQSMRMRRCVMDDTIVDIDTDERMRMWRQPLPDWLSEAWQARWGSEALIRAPLPGAHSPDEWPENTRWHALFGHSLRLRFPLNVGGELQGIIVLCLVHDETPGDFLLQQSVVLAQQAAIAMQMERLARLVESSAVRSERERMAAEIHDSLAQSFTSIAMQSESLAGLLSADAQKSRVLRLIERTAREGLAEARRSVLALLPADGWPGSLDQSLAALAERSSIIGGIVCRFESTGRPCGMSGVTQESLLRIAQEATSNAMRHSGGSHVLIRLDYEPHTLRLTVEDDGRGLPPPEGPRQNGGFGVSGMGSRAAAIGGTVTLGRSALGGVAVCVDLPSPGAGGAAA